MISFRPSQSKNTLHAGRAARFAAGLMLAGALGVAGAGAAGAIEANPQKIEANPQAAVSVQKIETNPLKRIETNPLKRIETNPLEIETNPLIETNPQKRIEANPQY